MEKPQMEKRTSENKLLPLVAGIWRGSGVVELDSQQHSWEL